ncbi:hypothetical protein ADN00_18920 [Ornatilinea apprima]|uniref:HK97 gp10 family phage protein n=1 Tax=Ornatilinea apprima TaxID=1134406 RepID=A0A0P6XML9_9CHLR|nr:hypothetical protein ADN00_18920 [Ornatilinea apprima]
MAAQFPVATEAVVKKTTQEIEKISKESMEGPKSGRLYSRGKKTHHASAPGEPPAVDSGNLANSIQSEVSMQANGPRGVVFTNTEYAVGLEFGTRKMAARPFMKPAADRMRPIYLSALKKIEESLK